MSLEADAIAVPHDTAFRSSGDAIRFFGPVLSDRSTEHVLVAHLDADFRVTSVRTIAEGNAAAASLPVADMLRAALREGAARILLAHNHPSGDPMPSVQDKAATRRLAIATTALDIDLVDHIVVARGGAFSFRLQGLL